MTNSLRIAIMLFSFFIVAITVKALINKKIPIKYSLIWFSASFIIFLLSVFPKIFIYIAKILGFNMMSNMVMAIFIGILLIVTMTLTMIVSAQKQQITMLIQEVSLLKKK